MNRPTMPIIRVRLIQFAYSRAGKLVSVNRSSEDNGGLKIKRGLKVIFVAVGLLPIDSLIYRYCIEIRFDKSLKIA